MNLLKEGQVLDDKYVIVRRIAEGGMSTIYLGVNRRIGKDVAVKVLHPLVARDGDVVARFEREARIVSRIRSAHVADVYDFGELPSGERFMVMEYLDGESLATWLEREQTIPPRTLAAVAEQILLGLSAAHEVGVVHRDLKPENIVISSRGKGPMTAKLLDFGISKVLARGAAHESLNVKRTATNAVLGTPLYMSPEQARGNTASIDERTDIYSLGVILYEAAAGEPPLMGENVNDLLFRVALDEPIPLVERAPSVDPAFAAVVAKAMAKEAADRYQTADEMRDALVAWRAQDAASAAPAALAGHAAPSRGAAPAAVAPRDAATAASIEPPSAGTPTALTVPTDPAPDRDTRREARQKGQGRARRVALAAPLLGLVLLGVPTAHRAVVGHASSVAALAGGRPASLGSVPPPPDTPGAPRPAPRATAAEPAPPLSPSVPASAAPSPSTTAASDANARATEPARSPAHSSVTRASGAPRSKRSPGTREARGASTGAPATSAAARPPAPRAPDLTPPAVPRGAR